MQEELKVFTVDFQAQQKDGLVTSEDMVAYLQSKMKVKNCLKIAAREIQFKPSNSTVEISSKTGNITTRNMKLYLKRYLRTKSLKNFVKVSGDGAGTFKFVYINAVDEAEE